MEKERIETLRVKALELNEELLQLSDAVVKENQYHVTRLQGSIMGYLDWVIRLCNSVLYEGITLNEEMLVVMEEQCRFANSFIRNHERR